MSEYQVYEFVALDRPLTPTQMAELRAISTRADITPTRFWNEYQWGNLKADPATLVERYFDAHLYFANWGTRRLMLRLPAARVDKKQLRSVLPARGGAHDDERRSRGARSRQRDGRAGGRLRERRLAGSARARAE
jgi:hypothetical protein